jgi:hypothetical protein
MPYKIMKFGFATRVILTLLLRRCCIFVKKIEKKSKGTISEVFSEIPFFFAQRMILWGCFIK